MDNVAKTKPPRPSLESSTDLDLLCHATDGRQSLRDQIQAPQPLCDISIPRRRLIWGA